MIGFSSTRRRAAWSLKVLIVAGSLTVLEILACGGTTLRSQQRAPGFRLAKTTSPKTHLEAERKVTKALRLSRNDRELEEASFKALRSPYVPPRIDRKKCLHLQMCMGHHARASGTIIGIHLSFVAFVKCGSGTPLDLVSMLAEPIERLHSR